MKHFIHEKIRRVFEDFQHEATRTGGLCECKGLTYARGNSPNYENPLVQQNYMLRFFPAYLAEYRLMYENMLRQNFLMEQLKVLSIGCGCGVDLWGLHFALQERGEDPGARINYTGVDLIDWLYQDNMGMENARFLNQNVTDWDQLDQNDYNIFVFPKCIGEFSDSVFSSICRIFENTEFSERHVCGLCSLMDEGKDADAHRFRKIASIMQNHHGYHLLDDANKFTHYDSRGIRIFCHDFVYPDDILPEVSHILNVCPKYIENQNVPCQRDCNNMNRSPILTAQYINYQLLRFEL